MKLGETLYVTQRKAWRSWLAENHDRKKEIWLVYYRKSSGQPRISYNDAVEEALCYGWIDSNQKHIDQERFAQRFSPRRPTSKLSQMNKERIRKLMMKKKMTRAGLAAIGNHTLKEKFKIPIDILVALKKDKKIWRTFQDFPESYKRIRVAFIESRKRQGKEQYQKALQHFLKMTAKNERFGYVKEMS
jgi:uncharacterized protein YdeI (YjbR/CyaY-like superfamily)